MLSKTEDRHAHGAARTDPTQTGRLRSAFRAEARKLVSMYLVRLKDVLINQDFFGAYSPAPSLHPLMQASRRNPNLDNKLAVFTNYANQLAYTFIVGNGEWLFPFIEQAFVHGMRAGAKWAPIQYELPERIYYQHARNEIEGIADALTQHVARAVAEGMTKDMLPREIAARVQAIVRKFEEQRIYALGHQIIVQQHNLGRLVQIRAAGLTQYGVQPESKIRKIKIGDALRPGIYEVLTAGDNDVCPQCQDYAENGPYDSNDLEIPLHINCRCAVVPITDERFAPSEEGD
jgi:hypothetical protein